MKEKIIHTRVSEELYEKISKKAKKHRITMSNFIRNVVEDGLDIYNDVADIVDTKIIEKMKGNDEIIGVQKMVLMKNQKCDYCQKELKKGAESLLEIYKNSSQKTLRCLECNK